MKKFLLASVALISISVFCIGCGGGSSTTPLQPKPALTPTSLFAFVSYTPTPGANALVNHRQGNGEQNYRFRNRVRLNGGLKPWVVDMDPGPMSVMTMKNDGTNLAMIADQAGMFESVQLSLDGKKGVFTAELTSSSGTWLQTYVADMSTGPNFVINQLTSDGEHHIDAQLSPDGKQVVFTKYNSTTNQDQAYTISASGGTETVIPIPDTMDVLSPTFTPDGKSIVFEDCNIDSINMVKLDGTGMVVLNNADGTYLDDQPSVSPDGTKIVFSQYNEQGRNIYVMDITGQNVVQLTTDGSSFDPMFVNNKIVFGSAMDEPTYGEIYSINPDGTGLQRLTTNSAEEWFSGWF